MKLTAETLRKIISYNPDTGDLIWKISKPGASVGTPVNGIHTNGYIGVSIEGGRYLAHRLAFLYMTENWPMGEIDHINGCRADNRWSNLRDCSHGENMRNRRLSKNNTSGAVGVYPAPRGGWRVRVRLDGKLLDCGTYQTQQEGIEARAVAVKKFHGEFARTA